MTAPADERRDRTIGVLLFGGGCLCFACLDTSAKWLSQHVPTIQVVWMRYVVAAALTFAFVNPLTSPHGFHSRKLWLQIARSLLLFGSTALNFFALRWLPIAETTAINFLMPLIVAVLAGPLLGEWIGPRRLAAVAVGFLGVLVLTHPFGGHFHPAALLVIGSVICYALYVIATRVLTRHDSPQTTLIWSSISGVVLLTPAMPFVWTMPDRLSVWLLLFIIGGLGGLGHWLIILANGRAPAPILAPFSYTQLIWAATLGFLVFGDVPTQWTFVGASIVVASGLYLWSRERAGAA